MLCFSPKIDLGNDVEIDAEHPLHLEFGFKMDHVLGVQNLSSRANIGHFLLYPNPVYDRFDEDIKYYKSDYLTINVSFMFESCYVAFVIFITTFSLECHFIAYFQFIYRHLIINFFTRFYRVNILIVLARNWM